jgi:peroxiredoxin
MKALILLLALIFLPTQAPVSAQTATKDGVKPVATDLERVKVGEPAPDFTLEDSEGKNVSLADYRGKKSVVLIFYRGHWWPYCVAQLGELQGLLNKQEREKSQVLAISIDGHEESKKLRQKLEAARNGGQTFPLLQDADHRVIDRYGLLNPDGKGWPHPTTYVIDKQGVVRWKLTETNYTVRPSNKQILHEVRKLKW